MSKSSLRAGTSPNGWKKGCQTWSWELLTSFFVVICCKKFDEILFN